MERKKRRGVDAGVDLDEHNRGVTDPTGHVSSGLQGGPMRREEAKESHAPVGPGPRAGEVPPSGRDDLIPVGDSGEESIGRSGARTPRAAGLEAEDEDEGL